MYTQTVSCLLHCLTLCCWGGSSRATKPLLLARDTQASLAGEPDAALIQGLCAVYIISGNDLKTICHSEQKQVQLSTMRPNGQGQRPWTWETSLSGLVTEAVAEGLLLALHLALARDSSRSHGKLVVTHSLTLYRHTWYFSNQMGKTYGAQAWAHHNLPSSQPLCAPAANRPRHGQTHGKRPLSAPPWKGSYSF